MNKERKLYLGIYFVIWSISILSFWIFNNEIDSMGYSLMVFYLILPITTFIISYLVGKDKNSKTFKYYLPIFFGIMYMLAEYATFSLLNMTSFSKFNLPDFTMIIIGAVISYLGILGGLLSCKFKERRKK